jgi:transcriptional regulator of acetoin/glycerol metabolism
MVKRKIKDCNRPWEFSKDEIDAALDLVRHRVPFTNVTLNLPILSLREAKHQAIMKALSLVEGNADRAAEILGVGRSTMYRFMKQFNIDRKVQ